MWDISRIGQYGILLLGISSEASRRRGMEKVNSFREPVGAAGFCAIWQRNGEAGIRKKQHNCKLTFLGEPEKGAWMERDFEKDIIELDAAIKSNAERDNTFTLSVLQRVKAIMLQQKEKLKAYEDTGLTPGEVQYLKDKSEPRMVVWTPAYQSYYSAGDEAECLCPVCDSDVVEDDDYFCPTCGQALKYHDEPN